MIDFNDIKSAALKMLDEDGYGDEFLVFLRNLF